MGRQNYSETGTGFTVEEARENAIDNARDEYGHQEGYSGAMNCATSEDTPKCLEQPKLSKTCTVEKIVQKGARKWETVFVIEPLWPSSGRTLELRNSTQGKAITRAKVMALQNQSEYRVVIDKRLVQGSDVIAKVKPKKSVRGKWLFSGMARC